MNRIAILLLSIFLLCSCEKNSDDIKLSFIGDSSIAYWDVEASFPNYITKNYAVPGVHIDYLKGHVASSNEILVIGIGGNDWTLVNNESQSYYINYEKTISEIKAKKIYLLQILPTSNLTRNAVIEKMNDSIAVRMKKYSHIKIINCYHYFEKDGVLKEDLTRDGLHLNDYGYNKLANIVKKEL